MSDLNSKIKTIADTVDELASAIEEKRGWDPGTIKDNCTSFTEYPTLVREIVGEGSDTMSLTTVFAYKQGESYGEYPTEGAFNPNTGEITYPNGWTDGDFVAYNRSSSQTPVWQSHAIFSSNGERMQGWTKPIRITGAQGPQGEKGEKGEKGEDGTDGTDGIDGSTYEYVYFRGISEEHKPSKPASGVGNNTDDYVPTEKNTVNINGNTVELKWSDRAQGVDETYKFEWRSERKKNDANTWSDFTVPILWAKYGEKGKDGDGVQYIFKLTAVYEKQDNPTPSDYETNSKYQGLESEEYIPTDLGWTDDPQDVSEKNPYCWVCIRKYRNGSWGAYSNPALWAKYGKDGADGSGGDGTDGYRNEFIYKRVASESVVNTISAPESVQEDLHEPDGWTNNPMGVTDDLQVELVSQREKVDGVWGNWSDPAIWSMYGKIGRDGNGVEYIYCVTTNESDIPTLPKSDPNSDESGQTFPMVVGNYSWYDDPISITNEIPVCWVAVRKQYYSEDETQLWSAYTGPSVWAKYGKDAKEGGGRTIFVYTYTNTTTAPSIDARGGSWNPETNIITAPKGWSDNTDSEDLTKGNYLWMSYASFNSSGSQLEDWHAPTRLTGEDGHNGTDGTSIEFIYRLVSNYDNYVQLKEWIVKNPLEKTQTAVVPSTDDTIIDTVWTDEPSGINGETYTIEAVSSRVYTEDGWSDWSTPVIWAMWGEDGMDGPGVEYIFLVTPDTYEGANGIEDMTSTIVLNNYMPNREEMLNHPRYQEWEFVPNDSFSTTEFDYSGYDWTDEPQDVGPNEPLEWVSIRRGTVDENGNVVWGTFSEPKLWGKYSEDGYSYKTSYVFARGTSFDQPVGGNFANPYPTADGTTDGKRDSNWYDSVPAGNGIVWMSMRTFRSDDSVVDDDWTVPRQMTDTANFQVEFTAADLSTLSNYTPNNFGKYDSESAWRDAEAEKGVVWGDDVPGALYMATATAHNDVWSDWAVVKIKGEKGDKGSNGTSVKIEGKFATLDDLKKEWSTYIANPDNYSGTFILPLETGDGYIVEEDGHLWVYDGNGTKFEDAWIDAGNIKGDSATIYIRFSDTATGAGMYPEGTIGKYIGVATFTGDVDSETLEDYTKYKWSPWSGDDGFGFEQVFIATTKYAAPTVPTHENVIDAVPTGWSDKPISVNSTTSPYVWYVTRRTNKGTDWPWEGDKDNEGYAALYSRYSYDGEAFHLELTDDQAIIPMENGAIDPDFIENHTVTTQMVMYAGDLAFTEGVTFSTNDSNIATADSNGVVTVNLTNLGDTSAIECIATYNQEPFKKTFHIVKTSNAFEIQTNKVVLERDPESGYLVDSDKKLLIWPKKWNGEKWSIANGKILFVTCYHTDGSVDEPESYSIASAESITISLSDEVNLSKIRLFLTDDNTNAGNEICFEEIGIIANGAPGTPGGPGESTVVTQLSNPASIIQIVKGEFASTIAQTNLQARKGSEFVQVSSVVIGAVRVNGNPKTGNYIPVSITPKLDTVSPYTDNNLTFTLISDKLDKAEQVIEIDLNITINNTAYTETKTIIIQYASENAVHLELTEDFVNVTDYDVKLISEDKPITTKAVLYDGLAEAAGEEYSADFINCTGSCDKTTGEVKVTGWDDSIKSASVIITAAYEGGSYSRTFVLNRSPYNWKLHLSHDIIKDDEREAITGVVRISGSRLDAIDNSKFVIEYSIDDSDEWKVLNYTTGQAGFTIPVENAIGKVTKHLIVRIRDNNNNIYDQETIGLIKDGKNASYYQIGVNYSWIVKDHNGKVISPLDTIKPIVWLINGSTKKSVTFTELTNAGYKIHVKIDDQLYENSFTSNDFTNGIPLDTVTINTQLVFYLYENKVNDPTTDNWYDYVEVDVVTNGGTGPVIYPAGEYDSTKTYIGTSKKAPYVFDSVSKKYYIAYGTCKGLSPATKLISNPDWSNITENGWVQMETYNAIYSDIGVFGQALVGKWVFYGDYMFSQMGTLEGSESDSYEDFHIPNWLPEDDENYDGDTDGTFIPNIVMNARTGSAWYLGKKGFCITDTEVTFANQSLRVTSDGVLLYDAKDVINWTSFLSNNFSTDPQDVTYNVNVGKNNYFLFYTTRGYDGATLGGWGTITINLKNIKGFEKNREFSLIVSTFTSKDTSIYVSFENKTILVPGRGLNYGMGTFTNYPIEQGYIYNFITLDTGEILLIDQHQAIN